jgi:hypothetical protein
MNGTPPKAIVYDVYRGKRDPSLRVATMPGAGLPNHFSKKDWILMPRQIVQHLHTDAARDIGVQGYCFFQLI